MFFSRRRRHTRSLCDWSSDVCSSDLVREQDQGKAIAGKSTLNRLELTPEGANEKSRYKKIVADGAAIDCLMVDLFIERSEERRVGKECSFRWSTYASEYGIAVVDVSR